MDLDLMATDLAGGIGDVDVKIVAHDLGAVVTGAEAQAQIHVNYLPGKRCAR